MEFDEKKQDWESEAVPDFQIFITSLGMQAMVFMGELSNPITNETKAELPRAKYLIETIAMIKEKTKNNLTYEEQKSVDDMLYTLRLKYAEKAK